MITAAEALKRAKEVNQKHIAEAKIKEAADQGMEQCWLGFRATGEVVEWLKSFGYVVRIERITRFERDYDTRILWNAEE